ncbi:hypothetical protein GJ744_008557 [Endocarpon pusillum]|uniref:Uncharacterized protein n=1 Tax=Endocarpon pusillum TaxID=364733 RepID=A0A8H7AGT2_9EURO|nr:hypothetical protein GJ744_008557 [Endocarpon pusillum]
MAGLLHDLELHQRTSLRTVEINENSGRRVVDLDELNKADAELAGKFGYNPVLKREFGYLSAFSFAVSISALFSAVSTTFIYPLSAGGSASAVWSWAISGAGCMCLAVSDGHRL